MHLDTLKKRETLGEKKRKRKRRVTELLLFVRERGRERQRDGESWSERETDNRWIRSKGLFECYCLNVYREKMKLKDR